MTPEHASRTALATALMRACHSRRDPAPLIDDAWGDRLVPDAFRAALRQRTLEQLDETARARAQANPEAALDAMLRANAAYADVILRARYTEDALQAAVARGVRQYVLIGAGFDSFACRRPPWGRGLDVYEIDHPATQQLKRQRLADCGVAESRLLHFIAADLSQEGLGSALARSAFRPTEPTFFAWIGVTMYLTREANLAALRDIAWSAALGSELVFTYVDQAALEPGYAAPQAFHRLKSQVSAAGEAFLSGFDPRALGQQLQDAGLQLLEDVDGEALADRYDRAALNGLQSAAAAHVAHARVGTASATRS